MILGVDLGEKTTGLATSDSLLASPYKTISHKNIEEAQKQVIRIIDQEKIDTVVVGFVEGKIKPMFTNFAKKLQHTLPNIKVVLWDETLTSRQATETMVKLNVAKTKRSQRQHEIAAAIILQSYLDSSD